MDVGSAGTQVVFSRLNLRRLGEANSSRYFVVSRETLFQSPVALTPYQSEERIDDAALGAIIDEAYAAAGIEPRDIDTGVVILTGEALRRENAQAIAACWRAKAATWSAPPPAITWRRCWRPTGPAPRAPRIENGQRILNVDIGGGTTKLALVEGGRVTATAALHVGGRLQVVDAAADRPPRSGRAIPRGRGGICLAPRRTVTAPRPGRGRRRHGRRAGRGDHAPAAVGEIGAALSHRSARRTGPSTA